MTAEAWADVGGIPPRALAARCLKRVGQGADMEQWIGRHVHPALRPWVRDLATDHRNRTDKGKRR